MSPIRKLDREVSSRIAAGEVIERPVSVCKELIENSLDAGAGRIVIDVAGGGVEKIRVSDDGSGIPSGELSLSVENYSTSKISRIEDVTTVRTLGFRGEALASIRSVSRLTISTRSRNEETGREIAWSGGELLRDVPVARAPGTDVTVEDLFHSLPARRKFLASPASEMRRISSLVQSLSLAFPRVAFILREGGRDLISYPSASLDERVRAVFGGDAFGRLTYFENRSGGPEIYGYVSQPDLTRGNRSLQFFFVNRRVVRDRLLSHAMVQAFHSLVPRDRFPIVVLFIEMPPDQIDINVHPAKAEIRFRDERGLHRQIVSSLRGALDVTDQTFQEKVRSVYQNIFPRGDAPEGGAADRGEAAEQIEWVFKEAPVSIFEGESERPIITTGGLYWQLHQSFILIQIRGGMVIVDQHAAHERVLFDQAKRSIAGSQPAVQSLLFPATLELTPQEFDKYEQLGEELASLGFEIEPFGARAIIIRSIPAGVKNWEEGRLLQKMLGDEGADTDDLLKSYACRSAVKAGTSLSPEEMESLTDQLFATEFPFTCPHGRPTMLRLGVADLEKRFQRTVRAEK